MSDRSLTDHEVAASLEKMIGKLQRGDPRSNRS